MGHEAWGTGGGGWVHAVVVAPGSPACVLREREMAPRARGDGRCDAQSGPGSKAQTGGEEMRHGVTAREDRRRGAMMGRRGEARPDDGGWGGRGMGLSGQLVRRWSPKRKERGEGVRDLGIFPKSRALQLNKTCST